uniref:Uncharacterized protein n=1 Tax=Strigamia maritima TaxID=126957 RepID=T1ILF5_STRMM
MQYNKQARKIVNKNLEKISAKRDLVYLKKPNRKVRLSEKILSQYSGPWEIIMKTAPNNYQFTNHTRKKVDIVNVERLKKFNKRVDKIIEDMDPPQVDFSPEVELIDENGEKQTQKLQDIDENERKDEITEKFIDDNNQIALKPLFEPEEIIEENKKILKHKKELRNRHQMSWNKIGKVVPGGDEENERRQHKCLFVCGRREPLRGRRSTQSHVANSETSARIEVHIRQPEAARPTCGWNSVPTPYIVPQQSTIRCTFGFHLIAVFLLSSAYQLSRNSEITARYQARYEEHSQPIAGALRSIFRANFWVDGNRGNFWPQPGHRVPPSDLGFSIQNQNFQKLQKFDFHQFLDHYGARGSWPNIAKMSEKDITKSAASGIPKLDRTNYVQWCVDVQLLLEEKEIWSFAVGKQEEPPATASAQEKQKFAKDKAKSRAIILQSLVPRLQPAAMKCKDTQAVWLHLKKLFEPSSIAREASLVETFYGIRRLENEELETFI